MIKEVLEVMLDLAASGILEIAGGRDPGKSVEAASVGGQISVIGIIEGLDLSAHAVCALR